MFPIGHVRALLTFKRHQDTQQELQSRKRWILKAKEGAKNVEYLMTSTTHQKILRVSKRELLEWREPVRKRKFSLTANPHIRIKDRPDHELTNDELLQRQRERILLKHGGLPISRVGVLYEEKEYVLLTEKSQFD